MPEMTIDPHDLAHRLLQQDGIHIDPALVDTTRPPLEIEHETRIIMEYGYDALVRYYCPTDPRLEPLPAAGSAA